MGNFNRDRGRSFGGRDFGRDRDRGDRPKFKATCSNCGKECEVPFRPTNGKPVYCSDCFERMGNGGRSDSPRQERSQFRAPQIDQSKGQFEKLNAKLDKILNLLETKVIETSVSTPLVETVKVEKVKATKTKKASSAKKK